MRSHQGSPLGWDWEKVWPGFRVKPPSSSSLAPHFQSLPRATRLFCDVYNPQRKRYYKQLPMLGPEHSMDPKVRLFLLYLMTFHFPSPFSLPDHLLLVLHV